MMMMMTVNTLNTEVITHVLRRHQFA